MKHTFYPRKPLLCRWGLHVTDKDHIKPNWSRKQKRTTSYSAFCKRCGIRLYKVDRYGNKRKEK